MYGSDQSASVEPSGFKQLIGAVRKTVLQWVMVSKEFMRMKPIAANLRQHLDWRIEVNIKI